MKKYLIYSVYFLFAKISFGQTYFNKYYDNFGVADIAHGVIIKDSTFLLITGGIDSNYHWQIKNYELDSKTGIKKNHISITDSFQFRGFGYYGRGVIKNDGIVMVGMAEDTNDIIGRILIAKLNWSGDTIWVKTYNVDTWSQLKDVVEIDGNFYAIGKSKTHNGTNFTDSKGLFVAFDSLGNMLYHKFIGNSGRIYNDIKVTNDNQLLISGQGDYTTFEGNYNAHYSKITTGGATWWSKKIDTPYGEGLDGAIPLSDSTTILYGGQADSTGASHNLIVKIDANGEILWKRWFGNKSGLFKMIMLEDGSFVACGEGLRNNLSTSVEGVLFKLCPDGSLLWERYYSGGDHLYDIVPTKEGGFIACGSGGGPSGTQDAWVIALDSLGFEKKTPIQSIPVCKIDDTIGISPDLKNTVGISVFPNPFSSTLSIKLNNSEQQPLSLKMFDFYGKLVLNKLTSLSRGVLSVNAEHLPNGVYILELSDSNTILGREKIIKQ